jgi:hypothetical protein
MSWGRWFLDDGTDKVGWALPCRHTQKFSISPDWPPSSQPTSLDSKIFADKRGRPQVEPDLDADAFDLTSEYLAIIQRLPQVRTERYESGVYHTEDGGDTWELLS